MIEIVFILISISIALLLIGALRSKNFFMKILYANSFSNNLVIIILLLSLFKGNSSFIDVAFIYVLTSFIVNIAILKKYKDKEF